MFFEQLSGALDALFRHHHRLGLARRIGDVALFVQAIQRVPILALPGAAPELVFEHGETKQGQNHFVDFLFVVFGVLFNGLPRRNAKGANGKWQFA